MYLQGEMSSKPTTETSAGTATPWARRPRTKPIAAWSLAPITAVAGEPMATNFAAANSPPDRLKPLSSTADLGSTMP